MYTENQKTERLNRGVVVGLIVLSLVPLIAGGIRLNQLANGMVHADTARYVAYPLPLVIHIISVSVYSIGGAFQFLVSFRRRYPLWHRRTGALLVFLGLVSALTGLWMTLIYPFAKFDGHSLYAIRLVVSLTMTYFVLAGVLAIYRRKYQNHGNWMIRAYSIGLGAGTQVLTHIPFLIFPSIQSEPVRTMSMALGWIINLIIAEWIIQTQNKKGSQ